MNTKRFIWVICLAVILTGAWDASADTGQAPTPANELMPATGAQIPDTLATATVPSVTEDVLPSLMRIGVSLIIIIGIIYLFVFLLKKLSGNRLGSGGKGKAVTIIEHTYIAPKKSVCLLKLANRAVLIGITDNQINHITECEWDALPIDKTTGRGTPDVGFSKMLGDAAKLFKRKDAGGGAHETTM